MTSFSDDSKDSNGDEWLRALEILNGIAEGPELTGRIPLEANLDLLHYISFKKGCYTGQELTARTKFKVLFTCLCYLFL